jgi:D-alanyl-D-alanine carboxypeptidase
MDLQKELTTMKYFLLAVGVLGVSVLGYLTYQTITLHQTVQRLTSELATMTMARDTLITENASSTESLAIANATIEALASELSLTSEELDELEDDYRTEKKKNSAFEDQIEEISGTLSDLDKLSKTDKELLQKYSKVYFLNEHYVPEKIVAIDKEYLYNEDNSKSIHSKVEPYLTEMLDDALDDGVKIWIVSAYRSFSTQSSLKSQYTQVYGTGANTFSADQGYSEHQLGTTLDFTTEGLGGGLDGFNNTAAYTWLTKNAHKYGFTLSYPENNAYYTYEPWHWRFVGEDLASDLHDDNAHFYDWEQRKIDTYLIKIFD